MREQGESDVTVSGLPAPHLIVIESDLPFGMLEARLNRPAQAGDPNHLRHRCIRGTVHPIVGQVAKSVGSLQRRRTKSQWAIPGALA